MSQVEGLCSLQLWNIVGVSEDVWKKKKVAVYGKE